MPSKPTLAVLIYRRIWKNFKSNLPVCSRSHQPAHCAAHPLLHQKHREKVSRRKRQKGIPKGVYETQLSYIRRNIYYCRIWENFNSNLPVCSRSHQPAHAARCPLRRPPALASETQRGFHLYLFPFNFPFIYISI